MSSAEEISVVTSQTTLNPHLNYQDDAVRFPCAPSQRHVPGDPGPKTRQLSAYIDDKLFSTPPERYFHAPPHHEFPRSVYRQENRSWNDGSSPDDDTDDDDDDEAEDDHRNQVVADKNNSSNAIITSTVSVNNGADLEKIGNGQPKNHSNLGAGGEMMVAKDGAGRCSNIGGRVSNNAVTIAEPEGDMYYSQYLQASEGPGSGGKDMVVDNGCGFSGRKDPSSFSNESGDSLRNIFSDLITGALMDDAVLLPCGHSFGNGGVQHIIRTKACYTCSQSVSEDSIAPNLSLRAAVQAFRREEEMLFYRASKRRRERFEQDKGWHGDPNIIDHTKCRGVQFPFAVTDRVIIKGNKRTPQRFVGREAVVTTQCLNGWYVVKTLDNAESVKLQYRSLAKVCDESSVKTVPSKMGPNWL